LWKLDGHDYGVGSGGVVAEPKVEAGLSRAGKRKGSADEAFGDVSGVSEVGVDGDLIDEIEARTSKGARLSYVSRAAEIFEDRKADKGDKREPVACDAIRRDCSNAQRAVG
jgi:hypothetical protein